MLEELKNAQSRVVGTKQLLRALRDGKVVTAYVADDADEFIFRRVLSACEEAGVKCIRVPEMAQLGKACRIEIDTAAAGILR